MVRVKKYPRNNKKRSVSGYTRKDGTRVKGYKRRKV